MDTRAPAAGRDPSSVAALVTLVTSVASGVLALTARGVWNGASDRPAVFLTFFGLTICLQLITVEVYNRGTMSFAGCGLLAMGFTFGVGAAMATAVVMAATLVVRRRPKLHRGLFDAAQFSLAAGAGTAFFEAFGAGHWNAIARIGPALGACAVYMALNIGLLIAAMSLSDGTPPLVLWRERFQWTTPYYLASGPLAIALTVAYEKVGITGLLAFTLPPAMMMFSVRQYVNRTRQSVEEVRQANEELQAANDDLRDLFEFAGGLASRAHDRDTLAVYAQEALARMTGAGVTFLEGDSAAGFPLVAGDKRIGSLLLDASANFDAERWDRLQEAILPQLATALESAELVAEVRRKHLATIAALSRSMEAKDDYTGGHTERLRSPHGSVTRAQTSTQSRSGHSSTTSARSGSPSGSCTSRARSTRKSGR
jgi:hypothetical protein